VTTEYLLHRALSARVFMKYLQFRRAKRSRSILEVHACI